MKPTFLPIIQRLRIESWVMDQPPKLVPFSLLGDADPVPARVSVEHPEQGQLLSLLYEISHEITAILDREELLRRIAARVKKLVDYQVFTVMLWLEDAQVLESVFSLRFEDAIPSAGSALSARF